MILRRIFQRARERDWGALAIEVALIVIGVFVGMRVNDWNQERKDRASEAVYFARIAQDVNRDVADMDEIIRVSAARMALLDQVLPKASGRPLPDGFDSARGRVGIESVPEFTDNPSSNGFALFILTPLEGNRSAYETLINAGAIAGMRDLQSLQLVQEYYAAVDRERHFEVGLEQNRDKLVDAQRKLGISPLNPMSVDEIAHALASNAELLATAQNYWLYTNRHLKLMRSLQGQARSLAASLEHKPAPPRSR